MVSTLFRVISNRTAIFVKGTSSTSADTYTARCVGSNAQAWYKILHETKALARAVILYNVDLAKKTIRRSLLVAPYSALLVLAHATPGHAQEIQITGPLACAPVPEALRVGPSPFEWTHWASGGVSTQGRVSLGIGAAGSFPLFRYIGFPTVGATGWGSRAEVRWGPWIQGTTSLPGAALEGGAGITVGGATEAMFGTFGLRAGAGYRDFSAEFHPHVVVTLTWGAHSFLSRYEKVELCKPTHPKPVAFGSVLRLFATYRAEPTFEHAEWTFGLELTPAHLLPPQIEWRKVFGLAAYRAPLRTRG